MLAINPAIKAMGMPMMQVMMNPVIAIANKLVLGIAMNTIVQTASQVRNKINLGALSTGVNQ